MFDMFGKEPILFKKTGIVALLKPISYRLWRITNHMHDWYVSCIHIPAD